MKQRMVLAILRFSRGGRSVADHGRNATNRPFAVPRSRHLDRRRFHAAEQAGGFQTKNARKNTGFLVDSDSGGTFEKGEIDA
jgi:hypothetical protein